MKPQPPPKNDRFDNYVPVAERIEKFYERFPEGKILTQIVEHDREGGFVLIRAEIYRNPDDASPAATGHAYEYKDSGYVQKTSYIEVAETSAVGRGLAFLNFETKRGIASREEMEKFTRVVGEATTDRGATESDAGERRDASERAATESRPRETATEQPATDEQKAEILTLLEDLRPKDRRAQRKLLTELTGKQSRDALTRQEAQRFIEDLRKGGL